MKEFPRLIDMPKRVGSLEFWELSDKTQVVEPKPRFSGVKTSLGLHTASRCGLQSTIRLITSQVFGFSSFSAHKAKRLDNVVKFDA